MFWTGPEGRGRKGAYMGRGCRCKKRLAFGMAAAFLENLQKIYKLPIFLLPNRFGYGNISFVRLFTRLSFGYKAYAKPGKRFSRSGGIGRRARFRSVWWQYLVGSTPIFCTVGRKARRISSGFAPVLYVSGFFICQGRPGIKCHAENPQKSDPARLWAKGPR